MKIAFLRPNLGGQRSNDAIEPLGFAVLSGLTDRKKHEVLLFDERIEDIPMDKQLVQYLREYAEEVRQKNGEVASITELLETFLFPRYMHGALIGTLSGGERIKFILL